MNVYAAALLLALGVPGASSCSVPSESNSEAPASAPAIPDTIVEIARARLAEDTQQSNRARLVSAERATFNDGSLGCPQPGMFYTMAIVEGYRVIFEVEGETFDYRLNSQGAIKRCNATGIEVHASKPGMG